MIEIAEIGRRIKKVREANYMTLKKVEAKAGISATHISEIERGKTSPTINALIRIAKALEKDPAYFIEERELQDVSFIALEDRTKKEMDWKDGGEMTDLTHSIPSGKINSRLISLEPQEKKEWKLHAHDADEAALIMSGQVTFHVEGKDYTLSGGDSIYIAGSQEHDFINASDKEEAELIWFGSERNIH
jgi:transcriptional regulator with XRE-family HTH domain